MSKLEYLQQKKLNPADELRDLIHYLEDQRPALKVMTPDQALNLLRILDQAETLFYQLEEASLNLLPERGRFKAIQNSLQGRARTILKALGGPGVLKQHRPEPAPPKERWWWYIDERVAAQNHHLIRRLVTMVIVTGLIVGGIILAFQTVLAPSPEVVARLDAENDALTFFDEANYPEALSSVERGLAVVPDDAGLLTFKGILLELLGQPDEAMQTFQAAQAQLSENPAAFYLGRGQLYMRIGQFDKAETDARVAMEMNDNSALAWLLLGQALESQDKKFESMSAYEQAGELALADGNFQVVVLARLGLGRVGLAPPSPATASPQE